MIPAQEPERKVEEERFTVEAGLLDNIVQQQQARQAEIAARYKPVMSVEETIERHRVMNRFIREYLTEGVDYGKVPGSPAEAKPALFLSGAEKLCAFFGYVPHFESIVSVEDWVGTQYGGEPLFYYSERCILSKDGAPVGEGKGSCSSRESKYRYRYSNRKCPQCNAEAIIPGKAEYGGGFICFQKKGGCGAKFKSNDAAMTGQTLGKVPNPDIADVVNTIIKMATKRAYIAATKTATGASQWFSQDSEEPPPPQVVSAPKTPQSPAEIEFRAAGKYEKLAMFQRAKATLKELLNDDHRCYYRIIGEKGEAQKSDQIKTLGKALAAYLALVAEIERLKNPPDLMEASPEITSEDIPF